MVSAPIDNQLWCQAFSTSEFIEEIRLASQATDYTDNSNQADYLANYLEDIGARSLLIENRYMDRHFIEEVGTFYSRCLSQKRNYTTRIHAFSRDLDLVQFRGILQDAKAGGREEAERELERDYLGFVVVRPLPSVPIGRTVLRTYASEDRKFYALADYTVHLTGLELKIRGLAFQQQDRGVAACATTAIWSALQRVCRHEGCRVPTPSQITEEAVRHYLSDSRPLPASGLSIVQILDALRAFDFPGDLVYDGSYSAEELAIYVNIYLRSGIPVILALDLPEGGHAVTAVGFAKGKKKSFPPLNSFGAEMLNGGFSKIYVHDDRFGPYCRAELSVVDPQRDPQHLTQQPSRYLAIEIDGRPRGKVRGAISPLYPKLRTTAREMYEAAIEIEPSLSQYIYGDLSVDVFFARSGEYQAELLDHADLDEDVLADFQIQVALSRYIGVTRWYVDGEPLADGLWDTTDRMRRETRAADALLGMIVYERAALPVFNKLRDNTGTLLW